MQAFKIAIEAIRQAFQELLGNRLRTILSLLGIAVGIFCIVAVFASVDSMEVNVRGSLDTLGEDVVYVSKMPWGPAGRKKYWQFMKRPNPSYQDYRALKDHVASAQYVAYSTYIGEKTLKNGVNTAKVSLVAVTERYSDLYSLEFESGRFYSYGEYVSGAYKAIIGSEVAKKLFGTLEPVGRSFKYKGARLKVIGVTKKEGENLVSINNHDNMVLIAMPLAAKVANLNTRFRFGGANLMVKAKPGVDLDDLKGEIKTKMRAIRHTRPQDDDNFSLNTLSIITGFLSVIFSTMNVAGMLIGGFAILVGAVSIANIMFVSVKERTSIIGVKKALGAKRWFILLEFLVEAVVLSILGGILGLLLVRIAVVFISKAFTYEIFLSVENMLLGIGISAIVGVLAGLLPAFFAAKMDPVEAIRH